MNVIVKLKKIARESSYLPQIFKLFFILRWIIFNPIWTLVQKNYLLFSNKLLTEKERELLSKVNSKIYYKDTMYSGNGEHYYSVGLSAIRCIDEALDKAKIENIKTILDLPCGCGRVIRFLVTRFPDAEIMACDIDKEGVDFCSKTFKTIGFYSDSDFNKLSLGKQFDLIWVGSLITHLNANGILDFLNFCYRHLSSNGILIFTTHGQYVIDIIMHKYEEFRMQQEDALLSRQDYARQGYSFMAYPEASDYGFSITSYEWICSQLQKISGWQLVYFKDKGWDNFQDVFGVVKL